MRHDSAQSAQAAPGGSQKVAKSRDNGLSLLADRVRCSQLRFTHNDDSDLLSTRARCADIYTFPNDPSEEDCAEFRLTKGYVTSGVKSGSCGGAVGVSVHGWGSSTLRAEAPELECSTEQKGGKMSTVEHQATVDKGLKMKIKRKSVGAKTADSKHEIVKNEGSKCSVTGENRSVTGGPVNAGSCNPSVNMAVDKAGKHGVHGEKEKSPKLKNAHKKEKAAKDKVKSASDSTATAVSPPVSVNGVVNTCVSGNTNVLMNGHDMAGGGPVVATEPKAGEVPCTSKKEPALDPYEFNAKVEDGIGVPMKKMKVEKVETASSPVHPSSMCQDASTEMCSVAVSTEPECLGPCEPGTSVNLEGIVWHETENGVLVINVTWRGKTYVGTLLDATRHDWAPPRLTSESPVSDLEVRTPKGRGKRGRGGGTPVNDRNVGASEARKLRKGRRTSNANGFQAPPSPAKSDVGTGAKRKGRPPELDLASITEGVKPPKRSRSSSRGAPSVESPSSILIECPEPNCNKKYKHINGLRYHQTHAHQNISPVAELDAEDTKSGDAESVKDGESAEPVKDCKSNSGVKASKDSETGPKKSDKCSNKSDNGGETGQDEGSVSTRQSKSAETASSSQKSDTGAKKKEATVSTSSSGLSNTSPKTSVSSQVYQLAAAPIGCLGGAASLPQASGSSATITTSISQSPISSVSSVSNASGGISTTAHSDTVKSETGKDSEKQNKGEKGDKSKSKTSTRPIMPAPSPQMIALSSNVPVSHSSLNPVSTHAQMSPSLKPIQPKPTIMGEPSSVNPSLMGLKDKKAKSKKKSSKDKEKDSGKPTSKDGSMKDDLGKCERSGVIKSVSSPIKAGDGTKKDASLAETSKLIAEAQRSVASCGMMGSQLSPNLLDASPHGTRIPQAGNRDMSKTGSPLQVNTPDRKSPVNDDVQSPAYSDISDANDSASLGSTEEVPEKPKRAENDGKKDDKGQTQRSQPSSENPGMSQYGMYSYYGQHQSPYMMPHNLSQNSQKGSASSREETDMKAARDVDVIKKEVDSLPETSEENKPKTQQQEVGPSGRQQMTPQQMQEYQVQQQKWLQQMYALQTIPPQYQYLAAYGYGVDPAYHMHLMGTDPHYRQHNEKMIEDQKRAQEERYKAEEREHGKDGTRRPGTEEGRDLSTPSKYGQMSSAKSSDRPTDLRRPTATAVHPDSAAREQSLRDKRMENHQIIKENIELKPQMDKEKAKQEYEATYRMHDKHEDDLRRYYMMQQNLALQQRMVDGRKIDPSGKPSEPSPAKSSSGEKHGQDGKSHTAGSDHAGDTPKREAADSKSRDGSSGKNPPESSKFSEDKFRSEKARGEDPRNPRMGYPGPARGSPATSATTPTSNAPSQPSYASYISYPYMQSPYGHQIPFDPNHPMYRGINPVIGYANPTYLHPSQLGYRSGQGEVDEKTKASLVSTSSPSPKVGPPMNPDSDPKAVELLQHHASQYYPGHKIHELQEKGRSSSRSSPMSKTTDAPSTVSALEKHRESTTKSPPTQRHVHTHHHTHVVGGFPPMYGTYGAPIIGQQSSTPSSPGSGSPSAVAATPGIPHPYPSK